MLRGGYRGVNFRLLMKYFSTVRGFVDTFPLALIGVCTRLHRLSNESHGHGAFSTSQEQVRSLAIELLLAACADFLFLHPWAHG